MVYSHTTIQGVRGRDGEGAGDRERGGSEREGDRRDSGASDAHLNVTITHTHLLVSKESNEDH